MAEVRRVEDKRRNGLTLHARLGRQDKSADGCRAHLVGWLGIFVTFDHQQAGHSSKGTTTSMSQAPADCEKAAWSNEPA